MSDTNSTISGAAGSSTISSSTVDTVTGGLSVSGSASVSGSTDTTITGGASVDNADSVAGSGSVSSASGSDSVSIAGAVSGTDTITASSGTASVSTTPAVTVIPPAPVVIPQPATITIPAADPAPVVAPIQTQQQINDTRQLSIIEELLVNYKASLTGKIIPPARYQAAATDFANIFSRIFTNPTKESMDLLWNFFVENATGIMQESVALSGFEALAPAVRQRTELGYSLFRKATKGIDVANPSLVNQTTVKNSLKAPKVVAYLSAKSKTVKTKT